MSTTLAERVWAKVDVPDSDAWEDECWPWTAATRHSGHGHLGIVTPGGGRTTVAAHRLTYELVFGSISDDLILHHECENPGCCNPAHLTPMDRAAHTSEHRQLTSCRRGHTLPDDDGSPTGRRCRVCKAMNKKARRRMGLE